MPEPVDRLEVWRTIIEEGRLQNVGKCLNRIPLCAESSFCRRRQRRYPERFQGGKSFLCKPSDWSVCSSAVNEDYSRTHSDPPHITLNALNATSKCFQFLGIKPITFRNPDFFKHFRKICFLGANKLRSQTHHGERYQHCN